MPDCVDEGVGVYGFYNIIGIIFQHHFLDGLIIMNGGQYYNWNIKSALFSFKFF